MQHTNKQIDAEKTEFISVFLYIVLILTKLCIISIKIFSIIWINLCKMFIKSHVSRIPLLKKVKKSCIIIALRGDV